MESLVAELRGPGGRREIYLLPSEAAPQGVAGTGDWDSIEELPVPLLKIMPDGRILASNRGPSQRAVNQASATQPRATATCTSRDGRIRVRAKFRTATQSAVSVS